MKKKLIKIVLTIAILSVITGCSNNNGAAGQEAETATTAAETDNHQEPAQYTLSDVAMGTVVTESVYSQGEDITQEMIQKLKEVENQYISWRVDDSDIAAINRSAGDVNGTQVSEATAAYLEQVLKLAQDSGGAFDPTIGQITRLWDIDGENPQIPAAEELQRLLEHVGYEKITLTGTQVTLEQNSSIDLGAVGKGIGTDEARQLLAADERIQGAVISVGGSILVYGSKPDGSSWKVAITDPEDDADILGVLTLDGEHYVSTSGNYEKYFIEDGVRYHHIMDPATGYPAESGLSSVTVLCDNGLLSDGLSTACFVLGKDESLELLEQYDAEAIFVDEEKNVYLTDGMKAYFNLTQDGYQLSEW